MLICASHINDFIVQSGRFYSMPKRKAKTTTMIPPTTLPFQEEAKNLPIWVRVDYEQTGEPHRQSRRSDDAELEPMTHEEASFPPDGDGIPWLHPDVVDWLNAHIGSDHWTHVRIPHPTDEDAMDQVELAMADASFSLLKVHWDEPIDPE